ncbi:MAG: hypothetical protein WC233_06495 [Sphaerochaeta sp.]|jgi:hypothetical protein|nr:hypothetical protein [Spirochaetales bacterium]
MKRYIALTIVVSLISLVAFGATPTADFNVGTWVAEDSGIIVHDVQQQPVNSASSWSSLRAVGTSTDPVWLVLDNEGGEHGASRNLSVSVKTNQAGTYTLRATAGAMTSTENSAKVGFSVKVGQVTTNVLKSDTAKLINFTTVSVTSGMTYKTQNFSVTINETDYASAIAGQYTSTWTIELATT